MPARKASLPVPLDTAPMEAKLVDSLPEDQGWQFEPKCDGSPDSGVVTSR